MAQMTPIRIKDETAMKRLGAWLADVVEVGDVVLLDGPLGAGKTTLARGLIKEFCGAPDVPSPTFTLVETYEGGTGTLWHFDLYRLEKPGDAWELGLEDALDDAIALIEWPDRIEGLLPEGALRITISIKGEHREIRFNMPKKSQGKSQEKWQKRLALAAGLFGPGQENRLD